METKECKQCRITRPLSDFCIRFGVISNTCKHCGKALRRERKEFIKSIMPAVIKLREDLRNEREGL